MANRLGQLFMGQVPHNYIPIERSRAMVNGLTVAVQVTILCNHACPTYIPTYLLSSKEEKVGIMSKCHLLSPVCCRLGVIIKDALQLYIVYLHTLLYAVVAGRGNLTAST
jgi:hypothetical protein